VSPEELRRLKEAIALAPDDERPDASREAN